MTITRRILSLLLAALMLLPCGALAEEYVIPEGEITTTAIADAYAYGMQLNAELTFGLESEGGEDTPPYAALDGLLRQAKLTLSFYDDFGTARVRGALWLGGAAVATGDAQILEDGSVQLVTSLTGSSVLTLPEGTITEDGVDLALLVAGAPEVEIDLLDPAFASLPARTRFRLTVEDMELTVFNHLLGWISGVQRETGDLYVDNEDVIEATDTRDAVDRRLICTIRGWDFCQLFVNILRTTRDDRGEFLQASADMLAELGVTRYQVRQFIDKLFVDEKLDPAIEWVQPSATVYDDGALCTFDDMSYVTRKLLNSADIVMGNSTLAEIKFTLSYDENGDIVGVDLDVPVFSELTPYEGSFVYSVKTAEDESRAHTAHGELEILNGRRVIGDLNAAQNAKEGGATVSNLSVDVGILDHADGSTLAGTFNAEASFDASDDGASEAFALSAAFGVREDEERRPLADLSLAGETTLTDDGFSLTAQAKAALPIFPALVADVTFASAEFDGEAFPAGETADLTDPAVRASVREKALAGLFAAYLRAASDPDVTAALSAFAPAK